MLDPDMRLHEAPTTDTAVAFALFEHIAAKDPQSVAAKDDAIAVFRECMDAVSHRRDTPGEPKPLRLSGG